MIAKSHTSYSCRTYNGREFVEAAGNGHFIRMPLRIEDLRSVCTEASLERGKKYYQEGRVHILSKTGSSLAARVDGTSAYLVGVDLADGLNAICTCPYSREGYCKHIAAVLIAIIEKAHEEEGSDRDSFPDDPGSNFVNG